MQYIQEKTERVFCEKTVFNITFDFGETPLQEILFGIVVRNLKDIKINSSEHRTVTENSI